MFIGDFRAQQAGRYGLNGGIWALTFVFLLLVSCAEVSIPPASPTKAAEVPDQELWDATISFTRDGLPVATIQAGHIAKFSRRSVTYLDSSIAVDFFNEEGKHTSRLTADKGQVDEIRKDLLATGHVVAVTDSGATLRTPALRWDNRLRQIISDAEVAVTTATDTLYGIGFVSDENMKHWEIQKPTGRSFRTWERRAPRDTIPQEPVVADSVGAPKIGALKK
ncbi:MAG: LPS export ABC transporter periplasmic protein LptC [bacterium]